jgi:uncharacterized membrane protein YphA (DoxX/SURF4 family)
MQRSLISADWKATTRVAFRFFLVYFTLYAAATQILGGVFVFPGFSFPALGTRWPMRSITTWWADVLRVESPLITTGNSGDTAFYWVQTGWLLVTSIVMTAVWSELARRREYSHAHRWVRLFARFLLAAQMFYYGMAKVIPTQFPRPSLVTLLEPVGNLSLADLLWTWVGASTPYQVFTGIAEVLAGVLLVVPHTATLGAIVAFVDMVQVFVLNMTYDFGLKQISFHLILMALFLIAPDAPRLWQALLGNRVAAAAAPRSPFDGHRHARLALVAQVVFGLYLVAVFTNLSWTNWNAYSGGRARSPLYGIWAVADLSIDGMRQESSLNAYDYRWRRVIFDTPDVVVIQRTDDSFLHYVAAFDQARHLLVLRKGNSALFEARLDVQQPDVDTLVVDGKMEGSLVRAQLARVGLDEFRLLNSNFRWIRPPD